MIGVRLGPWVIEQEVGRGGMGAVYRARRAANAPPGPPRAAVKVLAAELAVEVGFQQRFQREIDILQQLEHPGIVRFYDSGQDNRRFWFAMEYIEGRSYESLRDEETRFDWVEVLALACQIAPALKHAHDRGIIHRDIKPANLLRPDNGDQAKLTDFGIASLFASPHLTVTGGIIGTPEYLSPEQAAGKPVTKKSDLYSFGVTLYALVTGRTPFVGEPIDLLHKHRFGQFDRPGRLVPDLPPDFDEIICNLLEKDPSNRPGDAGVLARRMESVRKKLERKGHGNTSHTVADAPVASNREGPATMASRVVREELKRLNEPGPVGKFINKPIVLVTLFILVVGTLVWTFWPSSAATMFERGAKLMASESPADWERAWSEYLDPLERKYPNHAYKEQVAELRQRYDEMVAEWKAGNMARLKSAVSEGQWFFEKGARLRRQGNEKGAKQQWQALIDAYRDVPAEKPWVRRAEQELGKPGDLGRYESLNEALRRAKQAEQQGKAKEAEDTRKALLQLYAGDEYAEKIIRAE